MVIKCTLTRRAVMSEGEESDRGRALAQAIVDTVREPLLVLDKDLRVIMATRSFYSTFAVKPSNTQGRFLYDLGDGQCNIPLLRDLLEKILPERSVLEDYEVEVDFPVIGWRTMLLNARQVNDAGNGPTTLLLAIEDVTKRRAVEREMQVLLEQKQLLLDEMHHRIANSLQIIASILMLKARSVQSDETRGHLQDAHARVLSVAAVQQHLQPLGHGAAIEIGPYLTTLCASLAKSMIRASSPIRLDVACTSGSMLSSEAVSVGLVVTESVINSLKYAFPIPTEQARIDVRFDSSDAGWELAIADNGVGKASSATEPEASGLGTSIVKALAHQLRADLSVTSTSHGMTVELTHIRMPGSLPLVA